MLLCNGTKTNNKVYNFFKKYSFLKFVFLFCFYFSKSRHIVCRKISMAHTYIAVTASDIVVSDFYLLFDLLKKNLKRIQLSCTYWFLDILRTLGISNAKTCKSLCSATCTCGPTSSTASRARRWWCRRRACGGT